jgi:site-specific recombinase XerD
MHERGGRPEDPLFPNRHNRPLSRGSVEHLVNKSAVVARHHDPSLAQKHMTPHVPRRGAATALLQNGVDRAEPITLPLSP